MHTEHGGSFDDDAEGFFLLHRRIRNGPYYLNPGLLQTLLYCLSHAAFRKRVVPMTTGRAVTRVELSEGQFITGRHAGAKELNIPPGTFWDRMKKMQELGTISIESNNHFSIVTVCNWSSYQNAKSTRRQRSNSTPSALRQHSNSTPTPIQQHSDTEKALLTIRNNEEQVGVGAAEVLTAWNSTEGAKRTETLGPTRLNELKLRLLDAEWRWRDALAKFPLRCYASEPEGWQPTFDWFIKPDSVNRILQGKYDFTKGNRNGNHQPTAGQHYSQKPLAGGF
jgi:hypothetical protein